MIKCTAIRIPLLVYIYRCGGSITLSDRSIRGKNVYENLADICEISENDKRITTNSTPKEPLFNNRVRWARNYWKDEGFLEPDIIGEWCLTEKALTFLDTINKK